MATENTEVQINNMNTTMRLVDLAPQTLEKMVRDIALRAFIEQQEHDKRAQAERRITGGVSHERDEEA